MKKKQIAIALAITVFCALIVPSLQGFLYSDSYAQQVGLKKVKEFCNRKGVEYAALSAAEKRETSLKYPHHFSWTYSLEGTQYTVGTWIAFDGHIELYSGSAN